MAGAKSGLIPSTGPLAATVPAVLGACVTALGQLALNHSPKSCNRRLNPPTVFPLTSYAQYIKTRSSVFFAMGRCQTNLSANGEVPKVGDIFVQADLARTLARLSPRKSVARRKATCRFDNGARLFLLGRSLSESAITCKLTADCLQRKTWRDFTPVSERPSKPITTVMRSTKPGFGRKVRRWSRP